jgi:hypothetical protein
VNLADNPIRLIYDALWDLLEANSLFASHARKTIKFTGTAMHPELDSVSEADLPEVRIVLGGLKPHPYNTSSSSRLTVTYRVQVATGEMLFASVLDMQWIVYAALHNWKTHIETLEWNGKTFAKKLTTDEVQDTDSNSKLNRGIRGWSTVWQGTVDCWFDSSDVAAVGT